MRSNNFAALRNLLLQEDGRFARETLLLGNDYAKVDLQPSLLFDGRDNAQIERRTSHLMLHPEGVVHSDHYFGRTQGRWVSILCRREHLTEILGFDPEAFPPELMRFLAYGEPSPYLDTRPLNAMLPGATVPAG